MLRLSNRFAGPVYRMQRALHHVVENGTVEVVRLRDSDYWHDFAADLNSALAKLASERQPSQPGPEEHAAEPVSLGGPTDSAPLTATEAFHLTTTR